MRGAGTVDSHLVTRQHDVLRERAMRSALVFVAFAGSSFSFVHGIPKWSFKYMRQTNITMLMSTLLLLALWMFLVALTSAMFAELFAQAHVTKECALVVGVTSSGICSQTGAQLV